MIFPILSFLYTFAVYSNGAPANSDLQMRTIGGTPADIKDFPYQVGLRVKIPGSSPNLCGGSLLSPTSILTAAHCFKNYGVYGNETEVILGATTLNSNDAIKFSTRDIVVHPDWNILASTQHDIAMVHMPPNLFNISGGETDGRRLSKVGLRIMSTTDCQDLFSYGVVTNSHLCTTSYGIVVGACNGDSGGPLVVYRNQRPVLVGVISFGDENSGCATADIPDVYTRVASYKGWINANLTP